MGSTQFNTRPTTAYEAVVDQIRLLTPVEQTQAYADAHAKELKNAVSSWLGRQVSGIKSWRRLLGHRPESDDGLPGDDHVEIWSSEDGMTYVSHPYGLSFATLKEMVRLAEEYELEFSLRGASWYYPGQTSTVMWRKRATSDDAT